MGATLLPCEGLTVFVGVTEVQGRLIGKVEANPSRLMDPLGRSLLPPNHIGWALESFWDMAVDWVEPACGLEQARVKRLDLARDFVVESAAFYVRGLATLKRPYATRVGVWLSPQSGHAETLHVGSGAGMVRLYDRFQVYGGSKGVPEGGLRWEVEARSDWMQRAGINRVADLTEYRMRRLAEARWDWSAMGVEVAATNVAVEKMLSAERQGKLSPAEARGFLGELLIRSCGLSTRMSKSTAAKYSRLERELGVTLAPEVQSANFSRRLDWRSGTEVVRVA